MRSLWISNCLLVVLALTVQAQGPAAKDKDHGELVQQMERVMKSLRAFQPQEVLDTLPRSQLPDSFKSFFSGWAYHQQGDYKQAYAALSKITNQDLGGDSYFINRYEELKHTAEELRHFAVLETDNFSIRYQEGRDKVLVLFLPEMLERIYAKYSTFFEYRRDQKIIVELMPDYQLFSEASALTKEQIETTGTIALCVENRLAVLTPRRVAQGYYWPDVIAHEFVHYILTKLSRDSVPLWMQEGTAKYFEARWHNDNTPVLDRSMESVLALAIEKDGLITVERMMPSFAALPTALLAHQAYAQTATMIDYLCKSKGESVLRRIYTGLRDHDGNMDVVLQQYLGQNFADFEAAWRVWLKQQGYKNHGDFEAEGVTLLDKDQSEEKVAALSEEDKLAKKYLRLGDLLLERNRYGAALKEYLKGLDVNDKPDRQMVLRVATCYRQLNQHDKVVSFIDNNIVDLKNDSTMLLLSAQAKIALHKDVEARALLRQALEINPFNPSIFRMLLEVERADSADLPDYKEALRLLTSPAPPKAPAPKDTKS